MIKHKYDLKKNVKFILRLLITIGLLIWLFNKADTNQFWLILESTKWQSLLTVWIITLIRFWLSSKKMQFILRKQDCNVPVSVIFAASVVTSFYSMFSPGFLSTSAKWFILKKHTGKGSHVFSGMAYNQFTEIFTRLLFGLSVLTVINPVNILLPGTNSKWIMPVVCAFLIIVLLAVSFFLLNSRIANKTFRCLSFTQFLLPEKLKHKTKDLISKLQIFQQLGYRFHLLVQLFTLLITLVGIGIYIISAKASNLKLPLEVFFWLPVLIYILGRIPISIANLGPRELALVTILSRYDVEASEALLMSMIIFSANIVMATIGAIYQISWAIKPKDEYH